MYMALATSKNTCVPTMNYQSLHVWSTARLQTSYQSFQTSIYIHPFLFPKSFDTEELLAR